MPQWIAEEENVWACRGFVWILGWKLNFPNLSNSLSVHLIYKAIKWLDQS